MLGEKERREIARVWERKLQQDAQGLPHAERHRNLEPVSAEFLCALAAGTQSKRIVEIGGSSGLSTIALATAAREVSGRVTSIEREAKRQSDAKQTLTGLGLERYVEFVLSDAETVLKTMGEVDFAFIDCEKEDYPRFFDMLHVKPGGIVVADNIYSHSLAKYVAHVRAKNVGDSITLNVGTGLEVTRFRATPQQ